MTFSELVEKKKIEARYNNIQTVKKDIDTADVKTKIENFLKRYEGLFTYEEIKNSILTNDIVAACFCKDPSKQNISEKLAGEVLGVNLLPQQGSHAIRFSPSGELVHAATGNSKAADFQIDDYYATQKFTTEKGGAQDNQKADVITFLRFGSINHKVMAILDGPYWDFYRNELYELFQNNPNVIITSVDELLNKKGRSIE